ncbi:MAG: hypothetical protein HRU09_20245 [Oligoflexales bacterium]|nr:hypothetical protein [Oligoflexales bacterium]
MVKKILIFSIPLMVVACTIPGQNPNEVRNENRSWPNPPKKSINLNYVKKTPIILERADTLCTPEKALEDLGTMKVWLFKKNKLVQTDVDLTGVSGKDLSSIVSSGAFYDFKHLVNYSECKSTGTSSYHCEASKITVEQKGKPVSICRSGGAYPAKSIENAALAGMSGLMQAYKSIKAAATKIKLPKVELLIHPYFESRIETKQESLVTFMTDNAFWTNASRTDSGFTIALLPHSQQFKMIFDRAPLWAQSRVISHEYGHHVFHHLAPNLFSSDKPLSISEEISQNFEAVLATLSAKAFGKENRKITNKEVISALNEGFADLIAHYAHDSGNNPWGSVVIGSFKKARDISSCDCDNGEVKSINKSVIKHFFSPHTSKPHSYLSVDHQDVHTVGAIIAHGIDDLLSRKTKANGASLSSIEKMNWLINWASRLNREFSTTSSYVPRALLRELMYHGINNLEQHDDPLSEEQCQIISRIFPVYVSHWENKDDFLCAQVKI